MEIFKNDNAWNEKAVVGFIAFSVMCMIMVADLVTGLVYQELKNLLKNEKINLPTCVYFY